MNFPETSPEMAEKIKTGKDRFIRILQQRGVELKTAVQLWEFAFCAGEMDAADRSQRHYDPMLKMWTDFGKRFLLVVLTLIVVGCSDARSSGRPEAERVFTDQPGYVCFLVRDEDGRGVGGNCVRE